MGEMMSGAFAALTAAARALAMVPEAFRGKSEQELDQLADWYDSQARYYYRLYEQAVSCCAERYGIPGESADASEYESAYAFLCSNEKLIKRLMAGRRIKEPDYRNVCRSAGCMRAFYVLSKDTLAEYRKLCLSLPDTAETYMEAAGREMENMSPAGVDWAVYPVPAEARTDAVYIGDIMEPLESAQGMGSLRTAGWIEDSEIGTALKKPVAYHGGRPFALFIDSEGEKVFTGTPEAPEADEICAQIVKNIIYQIVRGMPPYLYRILYIDPARGGRSLGELQKLYDAVDGNAYRLEDKLYHSTYRLLNIADTSEKAAAMLQALDNDIGIINRLRGGMTVEQYNASRLNEDGEIADDQTGIIPYTFVIFENTHGYLSEQMARVLEKAVECASDCGISLVVTSNRPVNSVLDNNENRILAKKPDRLELACNRPPFFSEYALGTAPKSSHGLGLYLRGIQQADFLAQVTGYFRPNLQVETAVEKLIDWDAESEWGQYSSDEAIEIPIGVNDRGQTTTIRLGNAENAHALLSGMTGSGKSSFMHTVINGIIMRYRPEDVNIWLSDYKAVEFTRYMTDTPPHIKYIGTAASMEYTYNFIDRIFAEYRRRQKLFGAVPSLTEYRKLNGPLSLPRIIIFIDEFHVMSNHCKVDPDYKEKLESLLKESRAVGITFFLSDQTCAVGLGGLTEAGKLQLGCRMSMRQDTMDEYNAVFNITNAKDVIPVQDVRQIVTKRSRRQINENGQEEFIHYFEHCKTLFASPELRDLIAAKSIATYGPCRDCEIVKEAKRERPDWQQFGAVTDSRVVPLFLGSSVKDGKAVSAELKTNFGENIISIVPDDMMLSSLFISMAESIGKVPGAEIYVLASEFDPLCSVLEPWLEQHRGPAFKFLTDEEEICRAIVSLTDIMSQRRRQREFGKIFVFWIGMTDLCRNFSYYPSARPAGAFEKTPAQPVSEMQQLGMELDKMLSFFEEESDAPAAPQPAEDDAQEDDSFLYNASEDITTLADEGPRRGIHQLVFCSSYSMLRSARVVKLDQFRHRVANRVSNDDAIDILGSSKCNRTLEGNALPASMAVYSDRINAVQFMPFYGEPEAEACGEE